MNKTKNGGSSKREPRKRNYNRHSPRRKDQPRPSQNQTKPKKGTADGKIIINSEPWEVRVAYQENGSVRELFVERVTKQSYVGSIFKGRVVRVLPGMQAAFVDIGLDRTAFLYVSEVHDEFNQFLDSNSEEIDLDEDQLMESGKVKGTPIQERLKEGQEILVQVSKAPMGTKGARLTCHITLPGRWLVLMPTMNHIGVSRRIANADERKRLRNLVTRIKRKGEGIIVRTASDGQDDEAVTNDARYLQKVWEDIQKRAAKAKAPSLIQAELSLALRAVRDLLTENTKKIYVDNEETCQELAHFVKLVIPKKRKLVELYQGEEPIFDHFNVENEISRLMDKKVWLKSGGYLIIEQTEALVAIDVNTGRFVGGKSFDETILQTNLEAVDEIVKQLRFRNMGGIIIIDFIDMDRASHREKVYRALEEALTADKARTNISKITSLGLVEMTRKRTQEYLGGALTDPCPACHGKGRRKSKTSICYELFRAIQRELPGISKDRVQLNVHPEIARLLGGEERSNLKALEARIKKSIVVSKDPRLHIEDFEIH